MDQDYEITTVIDKRSQTMLKIKNLGLSKSGNFMVKAFNEKMTQTENFTLIIKSKPKVQMSVSTQKDLYQVIVYSWVDAHSAPLKPFDFIQYFDNCLTGNAMATIKRNFRLEKSTRWSARQRDFRFLTCTGRSSLVTALTIATKRIEEISRSVLPTLLHKYRTYCGTCWKVGTKNSPIFTKVAQKVAPLFTWNENCVKISPKVCLFVGYVC